MLADVRDEEMTAGAAEVQLGLMSEAHKGVRKSDSLEEATTTADELATTVA